MDLWQEMLCEMAAGGGEEVRFPQLSDVEGLLEKRCYQALSEIKMILDDDSLSDRACFFKIEAIVRVFEEMGSDGGSRHDF